MTFAGDVAGKRILDVGRGCGPLFAALRDRGAIVTGFDTSTGMLEQARRRLGDGADLQVATPVSGPAAHSSRDHLAGKEPAVIGPALIVRTSSPEEPHRQKNLIARRTSSPEEPHRQKNSVTGNGAISCGTDRAVGRGDGRGRGGAALGEWWAAAVTVAGEQPPADLSAAVAEELVALWSDLGEAIRLAADRSWSVECDGLVLRIVMLSRLTAATPWQWIPVPLLATGVYQGVLKSAGIAFAPPCMAEIYGAGLRPG